MDNDLLVQLYVLSLAGGGACAVLLAEPLRLGITVLGLAVPLTLVAGIAEDYAKGTNATGLLTVVLGIPPFAGIPFGTTILLTAAGMHIHVIAGVFLGTASFFAANGVAIATLSIPDLAEHVRLRV